MSVNQPHAGPMRRAVTSSSPLLLLIGVVLIGLGLAAILGLFVFTTIFTLLLGSILALSGLVLGLLTLRSDATTRTKVIHGLVAIVLFGAGVYLLAHPRIGVAIASILFAVVFPIEGLIKLSAVSELRGSSGWMWMLVSGLVSIAFAFYVWSTGIFVSAGVLGLLVGLDLIVFGVALLAIASSPRREAVA